MTVETRYFTSTTITFKGIVIRRLLTSNSSGYELVGILQGKRFGIRVWKVDDDDVETELTSGSPVCTVIHSGISDDDGEYTASWIRSGSALDPTDRILVRVYSSKQTPTSWSLIQSFITEELGASNLDAATWTVYYWLYVLAGSVSFYYGSSTYDSRIENFTWTPAAVGVKEVLMDGLVFVN